MHALAAMLGLGAVLVAGCSSDSGGATRTQSKIDDGQLTVTTPAGTGPVDAVSWGLAAEPQSLDYVYSYDLPPNTVIANVCESLLRIGADFSIQPNLAEKVSTPDPLTYVYDLKQGVKFHDGTTMTSEDVAFSLNRHLDPDVGSYWGALFGNVTSIKATGDYQVTMKLKQPDSVINQLLAVIPGVIESKAFVSAKGKDYGSPEGSINCTGPFEVETWSKGQSITLSRFGDYWDTARAAEVGKLTFNFIQDPATRANALRSGALDGTYGVPASAINQLASGGVGTIYRGPSTSQISLIVSNLEGPLADVRIRRALSLAIDRNGFVKAALSGAGEPSKSYVSKFTWGTGPGREVYQAAYDALPSVDQDLEQAKRLVAEAGAPSAPIVIASSPRDPAIPLLANEVQAAARRIGLEAEIKTIPSDAYSALFGDEKARKGIDLFYTTFYADIADPLEIYEQTFTSTSFSNYAGWKNPEYDSLVQSALAESDPVKRAQLTTQAQKLAVDELLWLPIALTDNTLFLNKRITGAPASNAYVYYPWAAEIGAAG